MRLLAFAVLLSASAAFAKRGPLPDVNPVLHGKNQYMIKIDKTDCTPGVERCGMQILLVSKNVLSGETKWERELYQKSFDPDFETDVQEIYPKSMKLQKNKLVITDEKGSKYIVNAKTGKLVEPLKSIVYPAK